MTMTKALQSGRSTAKHDRSHARSGKLRSSSALRSGEGKPHSGLNSAVLRSMQDGGYSQTAIPQPAALHSGHSTIYPMLHTSPALHSNHSVNRLELDPAQLQHVSAAQDQCIINNPLFADDSCFHDTQQQQHEAADPEPAQQQPTSVLHTSDSHGQAMLSASTPDRQELPYTGRQSSPSCDSVQDGAERGNAFRPVPTAPPSTVSRNGRIVERAAKVSLPFACVSRFSSFDLWLYQRLCADSVLDCANLKHQISRCRITFLRHASP